MTVEGPTKPEVKMSESGGATKVTYLPMTPGEYKVNIKSGGKHIHGSPFVAAVSGRQTFLSTLGVDRCDIFYS